MEKYFKAQPGISTADRMRILQPIKNLSLGTAVVVSLAEYKNGAGSPQAQRIVIGRKINMAEKKATAIQLCSIDVTAEKLKAMFRTSPPMKLTDVIAGAKKKIGF